MQRLRKAIGLLLGAVLLLAAPAPVSAEATLGPFVFSDIAYGADKFVLVGQSGRAYTSSDGKTWTRHIIDPAVNIVELVYRDGHFIAWGFPSSGGTERTTIFTSQDGINWQHSPMDATTYAITTTGSQYVASLRGKMALSSDGVSWEEVPLSDAPDHPAFVRGDITAFVHDGSEIVGFDFYGNVYALSANGRFRVVGHLFEGAGRWTDRSTAQRNHTEWLAFPQRAAMADGRLYVTVTRPGDVKTYIYREPDVPTDPWEEIAVLPGAYTNIHYINGRFWAYGFGDGIITSEDGVNWRRVKTPHMRTVGLMYGAGTLVAADRTGIIMTSADGTTWDLVKAEPDQPFRTPVVLHPSSFKVRLNGRDVPAQVLVSNSRSLLPVRQMPELMNAEVIWHDKLFVVEIRTDRQVVILPIDSDIAAIPWGESVVPLDTPAVIHEGRTYVPVRFVAEMLGLRVDFDERTGTIILNSQY